MTLRGPEPKSSYWRGSLSSYREAIILRAEEILSMKNRGCAVEALQAEHDVIEQMLRGFQDAVVAGASRSDCLDILNTTIEFCGTHFAEEEELMRRAGSAQFSAHAAAHRILLANFADAGRRAAAEGLPLATLDAVDLLHEFHRHVRTFDSQDDPVTQV